VGGEIFRTCPDRPLGPPSLLHNGYRVFPTVKGSGCGVDHSPPSSAKVKERVGLYLFSPSGFSWSVQGWTLPLHLLFYICRKCTVCIMYLHTSMSICRFRYYICVVFVFGCFESISAVECNYSACVWYVKYGAPTMSVLKTILGIAGMKEIQAFPIPPTAILHFIPPPHPQSQQGKCKVKFSLSTPWRHRRDRGLAPHVINLGNRRRWVDIFMSRSFYPRERTTVPLEQEAGWASEPVWTSGEKNFEPRTFQQIA
jgi:hypothetical protein